MATAPTVSNQWTPEDDLLLKNAVEAGASLEALAKGAIQFSQRYTLQELRERWHSLLYDPDISAQAAAQIFELEISGINPASKFSRSEIGSNEVSLKRKSASIRREYYAMRKKFRSELFSNSDIGVFEPNTHEFTEQSAEFQKDVMQDGNRLIQSCMIGDDISDHLRLQEEDLDILRHAFPGAIRDIAVASCATNASGCYGLGGNVISSLAEGGNSFSEVDNRNGKTSLSLRKSSVDDDCQNSSVGFEAGQQFNSLNSDSLPSSKTIVFVADQPHLHHWRRMQDVSASSVAVSMSLQDPAQVVEDAILNDVEGKENSSTVCTGEFADPDSLLNLSNEDEMSLEDVDERDAKKCCINNTGLVVQDSVEDCHENDQAKTEPESVAEMIPVTVASAKPMISEVSTNVHGDQKMNSQSEVDTSSKSSVSDFTGLGDGKICCTLNTEDTEIPCNDDIFLLIHPSMSFGSSATQPTTGPMTSAAHEKDYEQALDFSIKANDSAKAFARQHIHCLPESHVRHHTSKTEIHDSRPQSLLPGSSKDGSQFAIPKQCTSFLAKKEVVGASMKNGLNPATVTEIMRSPEAGSARSQHPESVADLSLSDEEEFEFDDDVPYFSDVEAMILEMDLDPYDQDSNSVKQDPRYQYDETKRTIIRLEQCARSCLQRAMTSQEALGILYGRHLRHYIRKPEVLLGRSTDDIDVDIDLSTEGRANKISRRQAIIKMEADGSFFLKNLGKSSVSVNGVAVPSGQSLNLSTNCLIEIKGMCFIFEINQHYVRKQLGKFCMKNKGKVGECDWWAEEES